MVNWEIFPILYNVDEVAEFLTLSIQKAIELFTPKKKLRQGNTKRKLKLPKGIKRDMNQRNRWKQNIGLKGEKERKELRAKIRKLTNN